MFMADVSNIVRKMRIHSERNQSALGIGFPEQLVLMHLKAHGTSNQESIATFLDIDKGAIAKTIAKLEAKGLVSREVNAKNKREKVVSLQPAAHDVLLSMQSSYEGLEQSMFAGISAEDKETMERCISIIARNVSEL